MAYKSENEVTKVLGTFEKNKRGDHVQVSVIEDTKGNEASYDIRNMYTNDAGELCFTAKGIRIKSDMAANVILAILRDMRDHADSNYDAIMTVLKSEAEDNESDDEIGEEIGDTEEYDADNEYDADEIEL